MCFTQSKAFDEFKSVFKGDLVLPTDSNYLDDLKRWSILAERRAGLVAFVKSDEDVSAAVKLAVNAKVEIAVKGTCEWTDIYAKIKGVDITLPGHRLPMEVLSSTFQSISTRSLLIRKQRQCT
jgi:plasmid stability protein